MGNSCRGAGGTTVIIMENNIWRGFTKEEQHLYHRVEERDGQVEDNLSDTIQVGYEIVLERMESSLASIFATHFAPSDASGQRKENLYQSRKHN